MAAISDSTRRSYGAALKHYQAFCASAGFNPSALSEESAVEWLTSAAEGGSLRFRTIQGYRSAMHTWHQEQTLSSADNPMDSIAVTRLMLGMKKVTAQGEMEARRDTIVTQSLTPGLLKALRPILLPLSPSASQRMQWAAMAVAVAGLLRPNEFVGSFNLPERSLRFDQCVFKGAPAGKSGEFSTSLEIDLRITKADPFGANPPRVIHDREAIAALWNWIEERATMGDDGANIFACPEREGGAPVRLSIAKLNRSLEAAARKSGFGPMKFTGRCFRRGGASGLMLLDEPPELIAARGGWKTKAMVDVYADSHAKRVRDSRISHAAARR
jgi:hypothetical protein